MDVPISIGVMLTLGDVAWSRPCTAPSMPISTPRSCCSPSCSAGRFLDQMHASARRGRRSPAMLAALQGRDARRSSSAPTEPPSESRSPPCELRRACVLLSPRASASAVDGSVIEGQSSDRPLQPGDRRNALPVRRRAEDGRSMRARSICRARSRVRVSAACAEGTLLAEISPAACDNAVQAQAPAMSATRRPRLAALCPRRCIRSRC